MKDRGRILRAKGARPVVAFLVHDQGDEEPNSETCAAVVYALDAEHARALAITFSWSLADVPKDEADRLTVERLPQCDQFADRPRVAQYRRDEEAEREAGFSQEDQTKCTACDRADISSSLHRRPSWELCEDCGQCGGCGHDMLCSEIPPALAARKAKRQLRKFRRYLRAHPEHPSPHNYVRWLRETIARTEAQARLERSGRAAWQRLGYTPFRPNQQESEALRARKAIDPLEEAQRELDRIAAEPAPSFASYAAEHGVSADQILSRLQKEKGP